MHSYKFSKQTIEEIPSKETNNMKNKTTEIVFILDRSGSMAGLEEDTIGGFNSMIERQKKEDGEAYVSTVLFNHKSKVIHDRQPITNINSLDKTTYYVSGSTALLDAIGNSIQQIKQVHKHLKKDSRPDKTIFFITTDGLENASVKYSFPKIKKIIEAQQEKEHWEFIFLGANIDSIQEANKMGIRKDRTFDYYCDDIGTKKNFNAISNVLTKFRSDMDEEEIDESILQEFSKVKEYYKSKHNI